MSSRAHRSVIARCAFLVAADCGDHPTRHLLANAAFLIFLSPLFAAHEFFHASQWRYQQNCTLNGSLQVSQAWYDNEDLRWWMEATAQWAQQEAINGDTTYVNFIPNHFNESWRRIDTRNVSGSLPWPLPSDNAIAYSPLFPFYLIEKMNPGQINKDIIRQTWEAYEQTGNCGSMKPVIDGVLPTGQKISDIFPAYAEANYFLAYPTQQTVIQGLFGNDFRPARNRRTLDDL